MSELSQIDRGGSGRFRAGADWFVASRLAGVYCLQLGAPAERTVDLLHALSVHLDPAVDVAIADARTHRQWGGALLPLPEVRAEVGRLRLLLASYGGVEVALYTPSDQLTLTPAVQLVIYARTDRWSYLLEGAGLEERAALPVPAWRPAKAPLHPAPTLEAALQTAAARLALVESAA